MLSDNVNDCEKFNDSYRIKSTRHELHRYDYGEFFITICTKDRQCFLGHINGEKMYLSDIGKQVEYAICNVKEHYSFVDIPVFVVMPNHIHLIVVVNEDNDMQCVTNEQYKTEHAPSLRSVAGMSVAARKGRLSCVVGSIKASVTEYANEHNIPFCWQERFYDRIIRNHSEMMACQHYIDNNVINWFIDECNPNNHCNTL